MGVERAPTRRLSTARRAVGRVATLGILSIGAPVAFAYLWPQRLRSDSDAAMWIGWAAFMVRTQMYPIGLAAAACCAALVAARRWWRAGLAGALVLFELVPEFVNLPPGTRGAIEGRPLSLMSVNLRAGNRDHSTVLEQVRAESPDVLVLLEFTDPWRTDLEPALAEAYPHRFEATRDDAFGMAVYSKVPLLRPRRIDLGGSRVPGSRFVVEHDGRQIALYAVHLLPPFPSRTYIRGQRAQLADLLLMLGEEDLPVIVAGDFNATPRTPYMARLRRLGLREVHSLAGLFRGWSRGATWRSCGRAGVLPGIRIDQIYLGRELTCASSRVLGANGSDHRPIAVEVGFPSGVAP